MRNKGVMADGFERERALDPQGSFIVQAPAGSGKTELLMQRYLNLLSTVERPEEILALTFTKKGAGEMQNRIITALRAARDGGAPSEPHRAKTHELAKRALRRGDEMGWNILDSPGRLKVQTIDSFSASLVRQMPLASRLGGRPFIIEDAEGLYIEAARRTIMMVEEESPEGESVRKALAHLDNSIPALQGRLVIMLARRDQWLRHVDKRGDEYALRSLLEGSLRDMIECSLKRVREVVPKGRVSTLLSLARYAAGNLLDTESPIKALLDAGINGLPGGDADCLPLWQGISEMFLTKDGSWRSPGGINKGIGFPTGKGEAERRKNDFLELLEAWKGDAGLFNGLTKIKSLPAPRYGDEEWEILNALLHLLPITGRHLNGVFSEKGAVDFQAIALSALDALGTDESPTDLMLSLDLKIRHILIDEYQDTSRTQLSLLEALTRGWTPGDGRTIFLVGDPMQSIYLFREAQVGLFLDAKSSGIGGVKLTPLTLRSNFRSTPAIVEWVNGSFEAAFPLEEDPFTGSIRYSPSRAARDESDGSGVEVFLYPRRDDAAEAGRIASIIRDIPGDESAAVLCRSRAHLHEIVNALKENNIGFRAQEIDRLAERPVIQDLTALLRALLQPYDRVAWLAILRAPWCGLGLSDLHGLCMGDRESPVWALLNDERRVAGLSGGGRARVSRIIPVIERALSIKGRAPVRHLLEGLWTGLGGPACVNNDSMMKDAGAFLDLVESISEGAWLDIKTLEARIEGLYACNGADAGINLDLMTIHRAKGLEFDHVFIPGLGKKAKNGEKRLLQWMERGAGLLLAPVEKKGGGADSAIYNYLNLINREKESFQDIRLFYVAATRARKRLYLFGHVKEDGAGEISPAPSSFLSVIRPAIAKDMLTEAQGRQEKEASSAVNLRLKRLPAGWTGEGPAPSIDIDRGVEDATIKDGPEFYWAGEAIRHLGTTVHRYLCRIAGEGLAVWSRERIIAEEKRMGDMLHELGLSRGSARKISGEGVSILIKAIEDGRGRWILEDHGESRVELPLTGVIDGEIVHVIIDRTFIDGGIRWIIDYKTGAHEGGSLREFLDNERGRYRAQLERYAEIFKAGGEKREIKKGLYYPALRAWVEV